SRRKRTATGQLFLDSRRQTLEVITGETSIQNITVTFGEDIVVTAAQVSPMVVIIVIVINRGQKHLTPMFSMNVVTHEDRGMMQLIEVVLDYHSVHASLTQMDIRAAGNSSADVAQSWRKAMGDTIQASWNPARPYCKSGHESLGATRPRCGKDWLRSALSRSFLDWLGKPIAAMSS